MLRCGRILKVLLFIIVLEFPRLVLIRQHAREKLTRAKALGRKVHSDQLREYREETGHESGNSHLHSNQHAFIGSELKVTDDAGTVPPFAAFFPTCPFNKPKGKEDTWHKKCK